MNCKNLTRAVELQYKFVEFSKTFFWGGVRLNNTDLLQR